MLDMIGCRLESILQLMAWVIFALWPAMLDYFVFLFNCKWTNLASGGKVMHMFFADQGKHSPPHTLSTAGSAAWCDALMS